MKKKGFTLIELLAVIVILAIIALIATPVVLGVIEKAKKGAAESSALGYIDAVEKQIAINILDSSKENIIANRTYSVEELTQLGVSIKGETPTGSITISKGQVESYILGTNGYVVENGVTTKSTNTKKYDNGYTIYYNPVTGEVCSDYVEENSINETKVGCMKWYAFNDKEGSGTVNLILDHNTTATVAYNSNNVNTEMKEVKESLENDTKTWKNVARLITANEIAKITNHSIFDSSKTGQSWFCLDTNQPDSTNYCAKEQSTSLYKWLFDYTNGCTSHGCDTPDENTYGYWTIVPYTGSPSLVWYVYRDGDLRYDDANFAYIGVRPVITISKDLIK